jgi:hypothetical protein
VTRNDDDDNNNNINNNNNSCSLPAFLVEGRCLKPYTDGGGVGFQNGGLLDMQSRLWWNGKYRQHRKYVPDVAGHYHRSNDLH